MDDLLRLARSHHARLSDPEFEEQCNQFNEMVVSALADFDTVRDLQRAWFNFRNAASALKIQCSKINQRWPAHTALSQVADGLLIDTEKDARKISNLQAPRPQGRHKCPNDPLLLSLVKFRVAAQDLNEMWQGMDGPHFIDTPDAYPFQESFDEVLSKISAWTEATFRRADGYCASCCVADHVQCSLTAGCPCCDMRTPNA